MLQPGESLDGYRVIRLIGSGGFGEVWLCQSEALGDFRALKFIPTADQGRLQKEFDALCRYRTAAGQLRSPSIMPIEHVNLRSDGLFYIMPLADGYGADAPMDAAWQPLTLAAVIESRRGEPTWFTSEEIKGYITPNLHALQLLSDAGLVHRDVKPENILFLTGTPCLGDISLLGEDSHNITRRGTPGYSAPSWFVESGGHPDMFGAATTLYSLLTGNPPDKMGRAAFRWPPQGEELLSAPEKQEWQRIHRIIRRAVDERPAERFGTFDAVAQALNGRTDGPRGSTKKERLLLAGVLVLVLAAGVTVALKRPFRDTPKPPVETPTAAQKSDPSNPVSLTGNGRQIPEMYRKDLQGLDGALNAARKVLVGSPELISKPVDAAVESLQKLSEDYSIPITSISARLQEIQNKLEMALEKLPPRPTNDEINGAWRPIDALEKKIRSLAQTTEERVAYDWDVAPLIDEKTGQLDQEIADAQKFRGEQADRITQALSLFQENLEKGFSEDGGDANGFNLDLWMSLSAFNATVNISVR